MHFGNLVHQVNRDVAKGGDGAESAYFLLKVCVPGRPHQND
jgi:hypothetical protein